MAGKVIDFDRIKHKTIVRVGRDSRKRLYFQAASGHIMKAETVIKQGIMTDMEIEEIKANLEEQDQLKGASQSTSSTQLILYWPKKNLPSAGAAFVAAGTGK